LLPTYRCLFGRLRLRFRSLGRLLLWLVALQGQGDFSLGRNHLPQRGLASIPIDGRDGRFFQSLLPGRGYFQHGCHHLLPVLGFLIDWSLLFPPALVLVIGRNESYRHPVVPGQNAVVLCVRGKPEGPVLRRGAAREPASSFVWQETHDGPLNGFA